MIETHPANVTATDADTDTNTARRLSRRAMVRLAASAGAAALVAACGESAVPTAVNTPRPPTAAAVAVAPTLAPPTSVPPTVAPATVAPMSTTPATAAGAAATVAPTRAATTAAIVAAPPTAAPAVATAPAASAASGRIPGGVPGVPDAYLKAPAPFKSVQMTPGKGGKVTTFQIAYNPPPRPRGENRYWQELERRLGVTLEPSFTPAGAYAEKIAAVTAGGSIADLTWVGLLNAPSQNQAIQQGAYADLTPFVTGDALKEFPNLAAFPERLWKNATIKGKIFGVPRPMLTPGDPLIWRQDWATKVGIPQPKNTDEFLRVMTEFTKSDPDGNGRADTYGMAGSTTIAGSGFNLAYFMQVFRVPNGWRKNPDGTLTNAIETEEFRAAVAYQRRLFEAGIWHPDSATLTNAQNRDAFRASKYGAYGSNLFIYGTAGARATLKQVTPTGDTVPLLPFGHDGGKGVAHTGLQYFGFVCLPARVGRDRERVRELLRVLDFYAAPFGSEEQVFAEYGIEGVHHTVMADGSRVRNDAYISDASDFPNLSNGLAALYYPHAPDDAVVVQKLMGEMIAIGVENPALTAFSPTEATKAGELNQLRVDRINAIVTGREPASALDAYIRDWRSRGGDQMRRELQDDLKA